MMDRSRLVVNIPQKMTFAAVVTPWLRKIKQKARCYVLLRGCSCPTDACTDPTSCTKVAELQSPDFSSSPMCQSLQDSVMVFPPENVILWFVIWLLKTERYIQMLLKIWSFISFWQVRVVKNIYKVCFFLFGENVLPLN